MIIIEHRRNSVSELKRVPRDNGVEIDIRSDSDGLYLAHDPFVRGERLEHWLHFFDHRMLVLNVKEEGLEASCESLLAESDVHDYFFLDQSAPFLINRGLAGKRDGACRVSDFESPAIPALRLSEWAWMDSFLGGDLDLQTIRDIQRQGLRVCLVSPELHSPKRLAEAQRLAAVVKASRLRPDAVCTKEAALWKS